MIFRYWNQSELDSQMNARGTVPDVIPFMVAYGRESARMRAELSCETNIAFGPKPEERLDFFPAKTPNAPIFVFIHGGYWRALDASDSSFMARTFVEAGSAVVAINYELAPQATLTEIVRQCRAALAWIAHNAARLNGDATRIHVSGSSAGGHLGGMMIAPGWASEYGLHDGFIQSASLFSGLYDLAPVRLSNCNDWVRLDAQEAARLSPLHHLPARPMPLVISYAPNETEEFKRQSETYASACAAKGMAVEIVLEPGTNHFALPMRLMDMRSNLTRATLAVMGLTER